MLIGALAEAFWLVVLAGQSGGQVVINELLPDPDGADGGAEFVELINVGTQARSLAEMKIQFANGAESPTWYTRWTGEADDLLAAGGRFLIVDRNWLGVVPGDAEVYLGLQNGPDAVRLEQEGMVLDLVGYGPLTDESLFEGHPVAVTPGAALARRPDGADTDDNHADFVQTDPTPGSVNFQPYALRVVSLVLEPPSLPQTGLTVAARWELENSGIHPLPAGTLAVLVGQQRLSVHWQELAPGLVRALQCFLRPTSPGLQILGLELPVSGIADTLRIDAGGLQVGPEGLVINEVLGAPDRNQGEWVELLVVGPEPVAGGDFSIRDEDGSWSSLPATTWLPGQLVVLAQDATALAAWRQDNQEHGAVSTCSANQIPAEVIQFPGAWPTLNNSPPESRSFPDRLWLAGPAQMVVDHVFLNEEGLATGIQLDEGKSLERLGVWPAGPGSTNWSVCTHPVGSTPGCLNSVFRATTSRIDLHLVPEFLDLHSGITSLHVRFTLESPATGWAVRVYDLWGGLVRDLGGDGLGPGSRDLIWDGRNDEGKVLFSGGYVVILEAFDEAGTTLEKAKALAVIRDDRGP